MHAQSSSPTKFPQPDTSKMVVDSTVPKQNGQGGSKQCGVKQENNETESMAGSFHINGAAQVRRGTSLQICPSADYRRSRKLLQHYQPGLRVRDVFVLAEAAAMHSKPRTSLKTRAILPRNMQLAGRNEIPTESSSGSPREILPKVLSMHLPTLRIVSNIL